MKRALALAVVLAAAACGATDAPPEPREPVPPFAHGAFYATLSGEARTFTVRDGDWLEDLGDAPFYGLAYLARAGADSTLEGAAHDRALRLITNADFFNGDLQEMIMAAFGLIEHAAAHRRADDVAALQEFVGRLGRVVSLVGWYVEFGADRSWALRTYGPTSISALIGLLHAQYALLLSTDDRADRVEWAREMEAKIAARAWNGSSFAFGAGREGLFLYPNVAMLLFEARLFQLTREERYRSRAVALYEAIQPLKLSDSPARYYSPYSAQQMGAKTRDYSTLSSQNYLMLALLVLYEITGEARYVREMDRVVDGMATQLHGSYCLHDVHRDACSPACAAGQACVATACEADRCQGGVLHHFIDGRVALPSDPSFFCAGCNLQLLYAMEYRQRLGK